jgi:hypothetical protein
VRLGRRRENPVRDQDAPIELFDLGAGEEWAGDDIERAATLDKVADGHLDSGKKVAVVVRVLRNDVAEREALILGLGVLMSPLGAR